MLTVRLLGSVLVRACCVCTTGVRHCPYSPSHPLTLSTSRPLTLSHHLFVIADNCPMVFNPTQVSPAWNSAVWAWLLTATSHAHPTTVACPVACADDAAVCTLAGRRTPTLMALVTPASSHECWESGSRGRGQARGCEGSPPSQCALAAHHVHPPSTLQVGRISVAPPMCCSPSRAFACDFIFPEYDH
jgi:hypothetical protein